MTSKKSSALKNETLPLFTTYLPDFALKQCELELKETPEKKSEQLTRLRQLLKVEEITRDITFEEDFLIQYLRHSKYEAHKACKRLRNVVDLRRKQPDFFKGLPEQYIVSQFSKPIILLMPKRCPDGCSIFVARLGKWNPDELTFDRFMQVNMIMFTQFLRDQLTQITGFKIIYDFHEASLQLLKMGTPSNAYYYYHSMIEDKCLEWYQKEALHVFTTLRLKVVAMYSAL
ncbi:alpha-tocopherol transfer protein-like [Nephila pilipes]|uniref:Alpha-tocopherol transfer protein-like n=1 Tax=Nephila pilipes TaxID=299642 RepID=A0A8X6U2U8_NEPPI|nr:alpha-tocopherol transfer protein-like [Nephila pilipes]